MLVVEEGALLRMKFMLAHVVETVLRCVACCGAQGQSRAPIVSCIAGIWNLCFWRSIKKWQQHFH